MDQDLDLWDPSGGQQSGDSFPSIHGSPWGSPGPILPLLRSARHMSYDRLWLARSREKGSGFTQTIQVSTAGDGSTQTRLSLPRCRALIVSVSLWPTDSRERTLSRLRLRMIG